LKPDFDVAVVGSGHNGLVAANYLTRAGLRVGVFEKRPVVGGAAVTEELWKGYYISRASYAYGLFDQRIVRDLQLGRAGLQVLSADPDIFVPFSRREVHLHLE
jgi:phytoene dehydrogenase-like protein